MLKDAGKAEDIVQETFITVFASINTLKEDAALSRMGQTVLQ